MTRDTATNRIFIARLGEIIMALQADFLHSLIICSVRLNSGDGMSYYKWKPLVFILKVGEFIREGGDIGMFITLVPNVL